MLLLKLTLVPASLLALTLVGRVFGPVVAGWLAGLPVVGGPILLLLALENGPAFTARAASASAGAVLASVAFSLAYARLSQRHAWPRCIALGLCAWLVSALILSALPASLPIHAGIAALTLALAPRFFPAVGAVVTARHASPVEIGLRMSAGAALTVVVTLAASRLGSTGSGLLAVFPILSLVLAVFSHRTNGPDYAGALLRALVGGMWSFATFCVVLALVLPHVSLAAAFGVSVAACLLAQWVSRPGAWRRRAA